MEDRGARIVYSTAAGRTCLICGWPESDCRCSAKRATNKAGPDRPGKPGNVIAKLRVEKKGRGGKVVSVVYGLPENDAFLKDLCQELKRACGTGGTVVDAGVELQGDLRDKLRELLLKKGFVVKG